MTTVYVSEENLKSLVHHKLHTAGLDADTAQQVTDVLVHADITGVHSHGVMRVEHYCTRLAAGGLNKTAQFSIEQISPSVAILDSDDGMGHSALINATEHAIKLAQEEGLGFVSIKKHISLWRVILFCRDDHQQRVGCYCNDANRYLRGSSWRRRALFGN